MTFKIENITLIANNAKRGIKPVLWLFWNEENDDITVNNYFNQMVSFSTGDQVMVINQERTKIENYNIEVKYNIVKLIPNDNGGTQPTTTNYNDLINKPSINNIILTGNKTLDELGIQEKGEYLVENDLSEIKADIKTNSQAIAGFTDDLENINTNIDNINEELNSVNNNIGTINTDIIKIKSDVESNTQAISTNSQNILNNTQSIAKLNDDIAKKANKGTTIEDYEIDNAYNKTEVDNLISTSETELESKIPTKVSELVNDSNYTNKVYVDGEIAKIKQFNYTIVPTLPAIGQADTIYLVSKTGGTTGDVYDEYMWINNKWEIIGTTAVDLTGYATTTDLNNAINAEIIARENADNALQTSINGKANKATTLSGYGITDAYTKTETNNLLADKQNQLVAGSNIAINGATISATDTKYAAGNNISINSSNTISCDITTMKGATSTAIGAGGLVPTPVSGENTKYLRGDGTWATPTNTTYSVFRGASASSAGSSGLVRAPAAGQQNYFLRGDCTWANINIPQYISGNGITIADNTISLSGEEFTASEKTKLSGIATGAQVNKIEIIAVNGTNQTITNKRVNITVPTKTSQLTDDSGFITQATANNSYVSKTGYFPYSQEADKALVQTSRWNIYSSIEPLLVNGSLFYEPMNTNADDAVIQDTLGRLIRLSRVGHICYFEMDLRFIGNINAGYRSTVAEGILTNYMPLNKYTRFPAQIYCESDISYSQALEIYIEINKQDNCIYLYNNLVLNANVLRAPRIICNGSYISSSILES